MPDPVIVVFRNDLRLEDHDPFTDAAKSKSPVIPLYVFSERDYPIGGASRWWLHRSLMAHKARLQALGLPLVIRVAEAYGSWEEAVATMAQDAGASCVYWHRGFDPDLKRQDAALIARLSAKAVKYQTYAGALLWDPDAIANQSGGPYKVFTPFYRACLKQPAPRPPKGVPRGIVAPKDTLLSLKLNDLPLCRKVSWAAGIDAAWEPGEDGANKALKLFCKVGLKSYVKSRDFPAEDQGVSRLSPHLHFGEISPRKIWHAIEAAGSRQAATPFLRQLVWREFAYYSLVHFPTMVEKSLRPEFGRFPWRDATVADAGPEVEAWRRGRTGIPIVDAGMRELWHTGWMHNRVRMIVGSLLVKNLRVHWLEGARWFWDTLVDADLANNFMGWQWVAGTGFDAAPYFRIFNPVSQAQRFDPDGTYIRRWVPEIQSLPLPYLFSPWTADEATLERCQLVLGRHYPRPIVDLAASRADALAAYKRLRL